jgi:hypothetical protein
MDIYKSAEKLMRMDDAAWRRHANPWSVYTRFTCLPLIVLAIWSRVWLGWWCLVPLALAILWTFFNPRFFNEPKSLDSWASKGVMGERLFLNRESNPIAKHHVDMANILTVLSVLGVMILAYGLIVLSFWGVVAGMIATILPKVWFVDRMVWIYEDKKREAS